LGSSERIKEEELRVDVLLMGVGAALVFQMLAAYLLIPVLSRTYRRIHARWGLPRPRSALLRWVLFVALPAGALLVPMFGQYGVKLGILATPFALVLLAAAEGVLWYSARALARGPISRGSFPH